jgi:hypothetical protein
LKKGKQTMKILNKIIAMAGLTAVTIPQMAVSAVTFLLGSKAAYQNYL